MLIINTFKQALLLTFLNDNETNYNNYTNLLQSYRPTNFSVRLKTAASLEPLLDQDHSAIIPLVLVQVREAADRAMYQEVDQDPGEVHKHPARRAMVASKEREAIGAGSVRDC